MEPQNHVSQALGLAGERSRRRGLRVRETQVQTPALSRLSCVNSHKLVNLSQAAQSSLHNGMNSHLLGRQHRS